jgi:anti-anti-sigma factor
MSKILFAEHDGNHVLKFVGDIRLNLAPTLNGFLQQIGKRKENAVVIDLTETTCIDSTSLGVLAKIALESKSVLGVQPTLVTPNPDITRVVQSMGFDQIFIIIDHVMHSCDEALELPTHVMSEELLREQVLDAHRALMKLNKHNEACFCDLVEALELEKQPNDSPARAAG